MARKRVNFQSNPLFSGPSLAERETSVTPYREVPLGDIDVDPDQPRAIFKEEAIKELASSIEEHGLLSPILVRIAEGGTYRLIAGERRLRAFRLLGKNSIPAIVEKSDEDDARKLSKQLVENLQREDLSSMERALAIGQLKNRYGLSVREIAKKLGTSKSSVQRSIDILTFPEDMQEALLAGVPESKVFVLSKLKDANQRKLWLAKVDDFTRTELESAIKTGEAGLSHGGTAKAKQKGAKLTAEDRRIIEDIKQKLGTRVHLVRKKGKNDQGRITIEFYSEEELAELYQRLTS